MATISSHHARAALRGLERHRIDPGPVLMRAGIHPESLTPSLGRISDHQMTRLVQEIWQATGDDFMGFCPNPCHQAAFGFSVDIMARCETLRDALNTGIQFYNLMQKDIQTELKERGERAELVTHFAAPEFDPECFFLEFWLVRWHRLASWLCDQRISLMRVDFDRHPAWNNDPAWPNSPAHRNELSIMFPGDIHPDSGHNGFTFPSALLSQPVQRSRSEVMQFLKTAPALLLTIPGDDRSLRQRIVQQLETVGVLNFPSLTDLADALSLSCQGLQRQLKREGTSYQRIKDDIRRELALSKLTRERLPVNRVAEIVGFAEPRSFTRAFKQWTGVSPREYCKSIE